jgi:hypothetical protein
MSLLQIAAHPAFSTIGDDIIIVTGFDEKLYDSLKGQME